MTGVVRRWAAAASLGAAVLVLGLLGSPRAAAEPVAATVIVRSSAGIPATTEIVVRTAPSVVVEDRTPGAHPARDDQGPATVGDTFTGEIDLLLRGVTLGREGVIAVNDELVADIRLFPEAGGAAVVVFVRQPVRYTVSRPSALGEITIALRARGRPDGTGAPSVGRVRGAAPGEVTLDAETVAYDQASDTVIARGGVSLTRGEVTLRADEVRYLRASGIAEAQGNVVLIGPEGTITGDAARVAVDDETGWIERATADLVESGYTLAAGRVEKGVGARYLIDDGVFTTCRCGGLERPSWSLACEHTDVRIGGVGLARGARFLVKDVPILWLPVLPFPVNTERQTGFLMPRFGFSNRRGLQYEQAFFWAIDRSRDLTLALDVETEARLGVIGEYRFVRSREWQGELTAAYYNEGIRGRPEGTIALTPEQLDIPRHRFVFAGRYEAPFLGGSRHYLDLFAVSDNQFLREIDNFSSSAETSVALRTTPYTRSRTGILKTWSGGLALLDATYYQDLVDPRSTTPQRLPQARAEHRRSVLDGRLVARVAVEGVDFQRREGFDGVRGDLAPELFVPWRAGPFHGSLTGRLRETVYHLTDTEPLGLAIPHDCLQIPGSAGARVVCDPATALTPAELRRARPVAGGVATFRVPRGVLPDLDRTRARELAEIRGRVGTELARVFDFPYLGLRRVRHSIEPEVRWLYVPPISSQQIERRGPPLVFANGFRTSDAFIARRYLFDEIDAINRRNAFAWGLSTRLVGRGGIDAAADWPDFGDAEAPEPGDDPAQRGVEARVAEAPRRNEDPPLEPTRELLRVALWHGYDVSRAVQSDGSHLSDVDVGLRITPSESLGLAYDATWSVPQRAVVGQALAVVVREPGWGPTPDNPFQGPSSVALAYNDVREQRSGVRGLPLAAGLTRQGAEDINGSVYLRLGRYAGFRFLARYDLDGGTFVDDDGKLREFGPGFLERDYVLRLISRCHCWAVEFGVADRVNPDERLFRIQLVLVGLGSFGQGPATHFVGLGGLEQFGYRQPAGLGRGAW